MQIQIVRSVNFEFLQGIVVFEGIADGNETLRADSIRPEVELDEDYIVSECLGDYLGAVVAKSIPGQIQA